MNDLPPMDLSNQPLHIDWETVTRKINSTPTLQVVVNPLLRRGSPIHDRAFAELRSLGADNVRFVPWFPYPRYAIAMVSGSGCRLTERSHGAPGTPS